jgi:ribosomal protein S27AE
MTYEEQLKDERWYEKRNEILRRDKNTCQSCGCSNRPMHVHHLKYLISAMAWEHPNWLLITYCDTCHNTEHLIGEDNRNIFEELIQTETIYIRPLAQLCVLIEKYPPFYERLRTFLNEMLIESLRHQEAQAVKSDL